MRRNGISHQPSSSRSRSEKNIDPDRNKNIKMIMRIVAVVGILIGVSLAISGYNQERNAEMGDEDWFDESSDGSFKMFIGLGIVLFSFSLLAISLMRKIATYQATEYSEAVGIIGDSAGSGIANGIRRGGGIKLEMGGSKPRSAPYPPLERQVIKVKCRKCGYLESEDATFCSKCGKKV